MSRDSERIKELACKLKEQNNLLVNYMNELEVIRDRRVEMQISTDTVTQLSNAVEDMLETSNKLDEVESSLNSIRS